MHDDELDDYGSDDGDAGEPLKETSDELADVLGVPPEKRDQFSSALHAYVKACVASEDADEGEGEEGGGKKPSGIALILGAKPKK